MKYLLDKDGKPVLGPNGFIMVDPEDGSEPIEKDFIGMEPTLATTRNEAKKYRQEKAELKALLDSIPEPVRANPKGAEDALITVSSLGEKQKVEIEKVRVEAEKAFEAKYKPVVENLTAKSQKLKDELINEKITNQFMITPVLDKTIFHKTRPAAFKVYREFFDIDDDGKLTAKDREGNLIYSKTKPGHLADFHEGLGNLIESDPYKEALMAPSDQRGTGHRQQGDTLNQGAPVGSVDRIKKGLEARNK